MKKQILLLLLISFSFSNTFGQTIINTEALLKEIDSTFAFKLNIEGNVNFGNIEFGQLNVKARKDNAIFHCFWFSFFFFYFFEQFETTCSLPSS